MEIIGRPGDDDNLNLQVSAIGTCAGKEHDNHCGVEQPETGERDHHDRVTVVDAERDGFAAFNLFLVDPQDRPALTGRWRMFRVHAVRSGERVVH